MVEACFGITLSIHGNSSRKKDAHSIQIQLNREISRYFPPWEKSKSQWNNGVLVYVSGHLEEFPNTLVGDVHISNRRREIDVPVYISSMDMSLEKDEFESLFVNLVVLAIKKIVIAVEAEPYVNKENDLVQKLNSVLVTILQKEI